MHKNNRDEPPPRTKSSNASPLHLKSYIVTSARHNDHIEITCMIKLVEEMQLRKQRLLRFHDCKSGCKGGQDDVEGKM